MTASPPPTQFDDILQFLASKPTLEQIIAFQPSEALQKRFETLVSHNSEETITPEMRGELDEILRMHHFMNRLRLQARQKLVSP